MATVADAAGTRTLAYTSRLELDTETLPSGFYGSGRVLDYDYDHPHRRTSFEIGASGADYAAALRYNTATGRPLGVTVTGVDVEFSYVSNSHLLDKLEFSEAGTSTVIFERDYTWDANANRVTGIEHTWDPAGTPVENRQSKLCW